MIRADSPATPGEVARHYDEVDPLYRALWGEHLHHGLWRTGRENPDEAVRAMIAEVAAAAGIAAGARVCDIGCGYGGTARALAERHGARVTGLTISAAQHRYALQASSSAASPVYLLRDWMRNGLPDGHFDAAVAIESMSHMPDIPGALREARRVLRPGGRLVMCLWLSSERPTPWEVRHLLRPIAEEGRLAGLPTAAEYRRWLAEAGMEEVEMEDLSERVWRSWSVGAARVALRLRRPSFWRYLLDGRHSERRFTLTVLRILLAYRRGCMRYALVRATRPAPG